MRSEKRSDSLVTVLRIFDTLKGVRELKQLLCRYVTYYQRPSTNLLLYFHTIGCLRANGSRQGESKILATHVA